MIFEKQRDKLYANLIEEEKEGKKVYYRKSQVYPVINKDGTFNWFNFLTGGSYLRLFMVLLFIIIALGFIFEYHNNLKECVEFMSEYNLEKISSSRVNMSAYFANSTLGNYSTINGGT